MPFSNNLANRLNLPSKVSISFFGSSWINFPWRVGNSRSRASSQFFFDTLVNSVQRKCSFLRLLYMEGYPIWKLLVMRYFPIGSPVRSWGLKMGCLECLLFKFFGSYSRTDCYWYRFPWVRPLFQKLLVEYPFSFLAQLLSVNSYPRSIWMVYPLMASPFLSSLISDVLWYPEHCCPNFLRARIVLKRP